ncbi:MAG: DUF2007 domain-containing protein [Nitrospiraceae bacterium]
MKKLFVAQSLPEVESLAELLAVEGIACFVKNRYGSSLAGEVPFAEVFPEIWVNEEDEARASALIAAQRAVSSDGGLWTCAECGESHGAVFTACWRCRRSRAIVTR